MTTYLPRFLIAVLAVPAAFALCAFAAVRFGASAPETPAAVIGALTFALVVTAPSTKNAAARALVAVLIAAASLGVAALAASAPGAASPATMTPVFMGVIEAVASV